MKVGQLKELLEEFDEEQEIFLAEQPGYPFEYSIKGIWMNDKTGKVFLVEGSQLNYLSGDDSECFDNYMD